VPAQLKVGIIVKHHEPWLKMGWFIYSFKVLSFSAAAENKIKHQK